MDEVLYKLDLWKKHLEAKALKVNMGKTKIMICSKNSLTDSGKHPCSVWYFNLLWIHKKCCGFKGRLKADLKYRYRRCMELCRPVDGRLEKHVTLESIQLDAVELFRYLDDKICP